MKFPKVKNVSGKLLSDELISVTPMAKYNGNIPVEFTNKPTVFNPGDIIHSFGYGWGITDENGKMVYCPRYRSKTTVFRQS